ncbi:MAG: hypothetical protein KKB38_20900 [Gammaproteobacteria bacterium]|nr:hypothetical protein [Gammaproteobacteria bacterium]
MANKRTGFLDGARIWKRGDFEPSLEAAMYEQDDFLGDILKDEWDVYVGAGCTVAIVAALNGTVALTTVAGDNLFAQLSHGLNFNALRACGIEARLSMDVITLATIEMGFNDALTEANGRAFDDYQLGVGAIPVPVAADAAILGFDPTDSPLHTGFTAVNAIAGVSPLAIDTGVVPVGGTFYVLRVQLDALGNAYYSVNGNLLATHLLAITPADPLTPWLAISNKAGAIARILTVDYVKFWQNRI